MDEKLRFEIRRKTAHFALTIWPIVFAYLMLGRWTAVGIYVAYLLFWMISEYLRVKFDMNTPTAYLLKRFSRRSVKGDLGSSRNRIRFPYWIAAGIVVLALFSYTVVIASTVCLAFGDVVSGLIKSSLPGKRGAMYIGALFGFIVSAAVIFTLLHMPYVALVAAAAGMLGDLMPRQLNDNAVIPIFAAIGAYAVLAV